MYLSHHSQDTESVVKFTTSCGDIDYVVKTKTIPNLYRMKPLTGITFKYPNDGPLEQEKVLRLYNPHNTTLTVTEVFISDPFLSLRELPSSLPNKKDYLNHELPVSRDISSWTIPPKQERKIVTLAITPNTTTLGSQHGYVHIVTNRDTIIIPVEAKLVTSELSSDNASDRIEPIVFHWPPYLEFGDITSTKETKTLSIWVSHVGQNDLQILNVRTALFNPSISIHKLVTFVQPAAVLGVPSHAPFSTGLKLDSNSTELNEQGDQDSHVKSTQLLENQLYLQKTLVATVTFTAMSSHSGVFSGTILFETRQIHDNEEHSDITFQIPYNASVMLGGIGFVQNQTMFLLPVANYTALPCPRTQAGKFHHSSLVDNQLGSNLDEKTYPLCDTAKISKSKISMKSIDPNDLVKLPNKSIDDNNLRFPLTLRPLQFTNYYSIPLQLTTVSVGSCSHELSFFNASLGSVQNARSLEPWLPIQLYFHSGLARHLLQTQPDLFPVTCWLEVWTNISTHRIPLQVFSGSLSLDFPNSVSYNSY
jgi:hypothetical protein